MAFRTPWKTLSCALPRADLEVDKDAWAIPGRNAREFARKSCCVPSSVELPQPAICYFASMRIGVIRETSPGEQRVALTPASVTSLAKMKASVVAERGCGAAAGFPDEAYAKAGAALACRD